MIAIATVPVGLTGVALEHTFRTIFAKPVAAAVFLFINGLVLFTGERLRRRQRSLQMAAARSLVRGRCLHHDGSDSGGRQRVGDPRLPWIRMRGSPGSPSVMPS